MERFLKLLGSNLFLLELLCFFASTCVSVWVACVVLGLFRRANLEQVLSACSGDCSQ